MADEQQLNSLNLFRKRSDRLVLEEHSHCEIPAGCGGVVLRWRNPLAALPLSIHLYTRARGTCWIDGTEVQLGRLDLAPGRHVLTVAIEEEERRGGLILFAAYHDPQEYSGRPKPPRGRGVRKVLTTSDGSWKYTLAAPPAEWTSLAFEDQSWPALVPAATPKLQSSDDGGYACRRCVELGAACLGLPPGPHPKRGAVWIRKVFEIPQESAS
jgi:hypothetical protein